MNDVVHGWEEQFGSVNPYTLTAEEAAEILHEEGYLVGHTRDGCWHWCKDDDEDLYAFDSSIKDKALHLVSVRSATERKGRITMANSTPKTVPHSIQVALVSLFEKACLHAEGFGPLPEYSLSSAIDALAFIHKVAREHPTLGIDFLIADDGAVSMVLELDGTTLTARLAEEGNRYTKGRCFAYGKEPFVNFDSLQEGIEWLLFVNDMETTDDFR